MKVAQRSSQKPQDKNQQIVDQVNKLLSSNSYGLKPRIQMKKCNRLVKYLVNKSIKYLVIDIVLVSIEKGKKK